MRVSIRGLRDNRSDDTVSNTAILNVFRRSREKVLKTAEVAGDLTIKQKQTGERLKELEKDGRVRSKSAGRGKVWWLDEDEVAIPVPESQAGLMWYRFHLNRLSKTLLYMAIGLYGSSGLLLVPFLLLDFAIFGQSALIGAMISSIFAIAGLVSHLLVMGMDRLVE